jgi:dTDP-L-rhamnose 4-epimerase
MLPAGVQLIVADIAEEETWGEIVSGMAPDVIVHLAAETGTGQSLAESRRHTHVNVTGTAVMLDALVRSKHLPKQLVLASSRAVYGEGAWRPLSGASEPIYPGQRSSSQLSEKKWDFAGLSPEPSRSSSTVPHPVSVYGATKLAQENILQAWTTSLNVGLKILRFQNVYGPGQSLTNAYTGIVSLFCRMAKHGQSIPLFEDGRMLRDFVFIEDVADALLRTVDEDAAFGQILDVGTGNAVPISQIASVIADLYGAPEPHLSEQYRLGDVRHASCDIQRTSELLGWRPKFAVRDGIKRLAVWIDEQLASNLAVRT